MAIGKRVAAWSAILVLGVAIGFFLGQHFQMSDALAASEINTLVFSQPASNPARAVEERKILAAEVDRLHNHFDLGARGWSFTYHAALFSSVALSAAAAILAKLSAGNKQRSENLAAIFAAIAALLISLNASLGFERKWIANRTARTASYQLKLDLMDTASTPAAVRQRIKDIVAAQSSQISTTK